MATLSMPVLTQQAKLLAFYPLLFMQISYLQDNFKMTLKLNAKAAKLQRATICNVLDLVQGGNHAMYCPQDGRACL